MPPKRRKQPSPSPSEDDNNIPLNETPPKQINPYTTLSLPTTTATTAEIKRAYRRAALQHHPDKAPASEKETAHAKFQEIAYAYAILSDTSRRARYDATGSLAEHEEDFNWADFYRSQYADVVSGEAIEKFAAEYRGSAEEKRDLLRAYERHGGEWDGVFEEVMMSEVLADEERFRRIIDEAVAAGEVRGFAGEGEGRWEARRVKARREAREVEEDKKKKGKAIGDGGKRDAAGLGDLAALIQQRQKGRSEDFFENLEAKYAPKGGSKKQKKRTADDEGPSEEAFARNREVGKKAARTKK